MTISWFPGHMHKARKELRATMPSLDIIIEVLDARLPSSSSNPMLDEICQNKPRIRLLSKADLADPNITQQWLNFLSDQDKPAIAIQQDKPATIKQLPKMCKQLRNSQAMSSLKIAIVGIPNVGKSSLINTLLNKKSAKVGNQPALTRGQQKFTTLEGITLADTPGVLWPRQRDPITALRLATSGAIRDTAIDQVEVALFGLDFLLSQYSGLCESYYKLKTTPETATSALEAIGRRRGCVVKGGLIDTHKAAGIIVTDIRNGNIGRLSFEAPAAEVMRLQQLDQLE